MTGLIKFLGIGCSGLIATGLMFFYIYCLNLFAFHKIGPWRNIFKVLGLADDDESFSTSIQVGRVTLGIAFAYGYDFILKILDIRDPFETVTFAAVIGFAHGFTITFVFALYFGMKLKHSVPEMLKLTFTYMTSHILYGLIVGIGIVTFVSQ